MKKDAKKDIPNIDVQPAKAVAIVKTEAVETLIPEQVISKRNLSVNEVSLVRLDFNGEEVLGSDFTTNVFTFERTYAKLTKGENPQYKVKSYNKKK